MGGGLDILYGQFWHDFSHHPALALSSGSLWGRAVHMGMVCFVYCGLGGLCTLSPTTAKRVRSAGGCAVKGRRALILRSSLWVLFVGLLLQGLGSLFFRLLPVLPAHAPLLVRGAFGIDFWHA